MGYLNGKLEVSLRHSYESEKRTLKLTPTSISEIENMFDITFGSRACSRVLKSRYLSESKRKELRNIYDRDLIFKNSVNGDGEYLEYMAPIEDVLSKHGIYDIAIEYDPPQDSVAQPVTTSRPKGILEKIGDLWAALAETA